MIFQRKKLCGCSLFSVEATETNNRDSYSRNFTDFVTVVRNGFMNINMFKVANGLCLKGKR